MLKKLGDVLTRDYASPLDPLIRRVRNPPAILALAIVASLLCGTFLHSRAFVLAAGLTAVLIVGTAWPWIALRGLAGTMSFDRARVREGEVVIARLVLHNRMPWGAWGLFIPVARGDGIGSVRASLAHVAGWRTTETNWEFTPTCRGAYPRSAPRIASAFPFGLREASRPLTVLAPLLVWPRTFPVGPIPEAATGESGDGLAPRNKPGAAGDLLGVRPYRRAPGASAATRKTRAPRARAAGRTPGSADRRTPAVEWRPATRLPSSHRAACWPSHPPRVAMAQA